MTGCRDHREGCTHVHLIDIAHFKLDITIGSDENLRLARQQTVAVIANARFAANQFWTFAFVLVDVTTACDAFVALVQ